MVHPLLRMVRTRARDLCSQQVFPQNPLASVQLAPSRTPVANGKDTAFMALLRLIGTRVTKLSTALEAPISPKRMNEGRPSGKHSPSQSRRVPPDESSSLALLYIIPQFDASTVSSVEEG